MRSAAIFNWRSIPSVSVVFMYTSISAPAQIDSVRIELECLFVEAGGRLEPVHLEVEDPCELDGSFDGLAVHRERSFRGGESIPHPVRRRWGRR